MQKKTRSCCLLIVTLAKEQLLVVERVRTRVLELKWTRNTLAPVVAPPSKAPVEAMCWVFRHLPQVVRCSGVHNRVGCLRGWRRLRSVGYKRAGYPKTSWAGAQSCAGRRRPGPWRWLGAVFVFRSCKSRTISQPTSFLLRR